MNSTDDISQRIVGHDKTAAVSVYRSIMEAIREGDLKAGDKLPNERELARRFATSRSTIRNVLAMMSTQGLVTRKVGSGSYLSENLNQQLSDTDRPVAAWHKEVPTYSEILEGRLLFEPMMMTLVTVRATEDDFAKMRHHLQGIREAQEWLQYKEHIYAVHQAMFAATRNRFLIQIFDNVIADRRAVQYDGQHSLHSAVSDIVREQTLRELTPLVEALEARDGKLAQKRADDYFTRILASLSVYG
ncbi:FadR/GntR family transcriptional regulator [Pantoea sp. At-9b]|uniref:FadR/GntR family transcriptional regulator n=1 Tax=Pantoea sp. (strain At-9b) TaxID=592316 RepID=UPI0001B3FDC4|nr:GntR family transcriptional regulator [Pantoea sp. At-9b]ADU72230.1 regulatory protein GntR HTH [Pantoea sp. At-9b]